ncbi:MAG: YqaJ viral recombinase family protein [Arthrobacter sp.]|jgi:hypothetical protein|nr:YqaJ viral recombinase family protein [Arthrobacter sp.]
MALKVYEKLEQGTDEWLQARCGIITASAIGQLIRKTAPDAVTVACPKCEAAAGDPCVSLARKTPVPIKTIHDERTLNTYDLPPVYRLDDGLTARRLLLTLAAERITQHVERIFPSRDMERGTLDEPYARAAYADAHKVTVQEIGFMVEDKWGFKLGYSPDGLVADDGLIEIKSRKPHVQVATVLEDEPPAENVAQIQTGLLVSGRSWLDYVSYAGGMHLYDTRILPDPAWQEALVSIGKEADALIEDIVSTYLKRIEGRPLTERIDHFPEMEITF